MIRRFIRETIYGIARHELAAFLKDHEEELLREFREEMRKMDERIPEERSFIDVKMVPLGETILKAALAAIREFLLSRPPTTPAGRTKRP
jgi:hypothetical protein